MLLDELAEVLARPRFSMVDHAVVVALLQRFRQDAELWDDPEVQVGATADPDDDYLVALARQSKADGVVSGDPDLLQAGLDDVKVLTPTVFPSWLAGHA